MDSNEILDSNFNDYENGHEGVPISLVSSNRFIIFYLLSLGLYGVWWMYKMWSFFKEKESLDIWPFARAIFGIFFIYRLFEKIKSFARSNNCNDEYPSEGLFGGFVVFSFLTRLPDPYWLISLLGFLFYLQPINVFNKAIANSKVYDGILDAQFNATQIVLMVVGAIFWSLLMIGLFAA